MGASSELGQLLKAPRRRLLSWALPMHSAFIAMNMLTECVPPIGRRRYRGYTHAMGERVSCWCGLRAAQISWARKGGQHCQKDIHLGTSTLVNALDSSKLLTAIPPYAGATCCDKAPPP